MTQFFMGLCEDCTQYDWVPALDVYRCRFCQGTLLAHRSPGAAEARRVELLATRDERARRLERLRHFEPPVIVFAPPPPAPEPAPLPPPVATPSPAAPALPASPAASDAKILTIDEVVARLKVGLNRVFELLKEGKLKRSKRIAGRTHVTVQSVEKLYPFDGPRTDSRGSDGLSTPAWRSGRRRSGESTWRGGRAAACP